jgi:LytS/YehU family sensor histidine kinase
MASIFKAVLFILIYLTVVILIFMSDNSELLLVVLSLSLMIPVIYLLNAKYKQGQEIIQLNEESLKSELSLLKSQINPHFFFNTLNNLYGLAVEKSEKTQDVIYKLSEMMRFTIYDGRKDSVSVKDEIRYLENFIELHKIRYQDRIDIQFEQDIENQKQRIPPLLFINLLENAFKHGADTKPDNPYIHFSLSTKKNEILFAIENNFEAQESVGKKAGIGIENLKRRLELLFPKKHHFLVEKAAEIYKTSVRIELV